MAIKMVYVWLGGLSAWCKGQQLSGAVLHSSDEPGELTQ